MSGFTGITQGVEAVPDNYGYTYSRIRDVTPCTNLNVYGVVCSCKSPRTTSTGEFCMVLNLVDESMGNTEDGLRCNIFAKCGNDLPPIHSLGRVIRFHRLSVSNFNGKPQAKGNCSNGRLKWVLFPRDTTTSQTYANSEGFTCTVADVRRTEALYKWWDKLKDIYYVSETADGPVGEPSTTIQNLDQQQGTAQVPGNLRHVDEPCGSKVSPSQSGILETRETKRISEQSKVKVTSIKSLKPENTYCNLFVQVLGVYSFPDDGSCVMLRVWDGTKRQYTPCHIIPEPLSEAKCCENAAPIPNVFKLDIYVFDDHVESALQLKPLNFVEIQNVHVKAFNQRLKRFVESAGNVFEEPLENYMQVVVHSGKQYNRGLRKVDPESVDAQALKERLVCGLEFSSIGDRKHSKELHECKRILSLLKNKGIGVCKGNSRDNDNDKLDKSTDTDDLSESQGMFIPGSTTETLGAHNSMRVTNSGHKLQHRHGEQGPLMYTRVFQLRASSQMHNMVVQVLDIYSTSSIDKWACLFVWDGTKAVCKSLRPNRDMLTGTNNLATTKYILPDNLILSVFLFGQQATYAKQLSPMDIIELQNVMIKKVDQKVMDFLFVKKSKKQVSNYVQVVVHGGADNALNVMKLDPLSDKAMTLQAYLDKKYPLHCTTKDQGTPRKSIGPLKEQIETESHRHNGEQLQNRVVRKTVTEEPNYQSSDLSNCSTPKRIRVEISVSPSTDSNSTDDIKLPHLRKHTRRIIEDDED